MSPLHSAAIAVGGLVAAAIVVMFTRIVAMRHNIVDRPTHRGLHSSEIPRGGGIGIVVVTMAGLVLLDAAAGRRLLPWCAAGLAVAVVGLFDDIKGLPTGLRMAVHVAAAIVAYLAYGAFDGVSIPFAGYVSFGPLAGALTVIWIAGFTNAFNFMDGANGIAGAQAMVGGGAWALIGYQRGDAVLLHLGILIGAASAGFLLHNWSPARIFMGDVGSTFLGYTLAAIGLFDAAVHRDALVPALIVWPFLFDSVFTFLRRLRKRENVFDAHRSHLYQRLILAGWSHAQVALLYTALALVGGAGAAGIDRGSLEPASVVAAVTLLAAALWLLTVRVEASRVRTATAA
jgi:UDP-N-acetylmuramyl pentapeptide phosphotransferase/UDP-N-acetylglucosamine-1-phosphate transferase